VTSRAQAVASRGAAVALVLVPALVITWAFRPGYMNADSLIEYSVTKPWGDFSDWRAPLIEKLWDAFETIGLGSPTIVLFAQTLTMVAGFFLVMRAVLGRVPAAVVAALLLFTPLVLSQVMLVGRDTWLTSFVVFQVGCVIRWSTSSGRPRRVWLALAVLTGLLVLATRQNGAVIEVFVATAAFARGYAERRPDRGRVRAAIVPLALAGASCLLAFVVVTTVPRLIGARDVEPEAFLYAYDLTGMSLRSDDVLIGPDAFPSQDLELLRERWNPRLVESVIVPIGEGPVLVDEHHPAAIDELATAWREEVADDPGAYLAVRWGLFSKILGISQAPTYVVHPGVDGPNPWGFAIANPDANDAFLDYLGLFNADDSFATGSDLFRAWIWLSAGLIAAGILLVPGRMRSRPGALEMGLLVVGAVLYEATFAVIAMGESFRYSYPAIVVSVLALAFTVACMATSRRAGADASPGAAADGDDGAEVTATATLPARVPRSAGV
jgi:hypothetical protein